MFALIAGAILGTLVGSAVGDTSGDWGCPPERRGHEIFEFGEGGGSPSPEEAPVDALDLIASDGQRGRSEYAAAFASSAGPTRSDASTGELFIDDELEVRIHVVQLPDGTWTISNMELCMRAPEFSSPFPTPIVEPPG